MTDQKDQPPNSTTQNSSSNSSFDEFMFPTNKTKNLFELQKLAYEEVLKAFYAESFTISKSKILIIQDLSKEWYITHKTHTTLVDGIKTDPLVQKLRYKNENEKKPRILKLKVTCRPPAKMPEEKAIPSSTLDDSPVISWGQVSPESPAKMPEEKAIPSCTLEDSPVISWGQVSPESLVEEWVSIRLPGGEDTYYRFHIKAYDAETEMHHLVPCFGQEDSNDPCNWIDLRHIPAEDIVWANKDPGFIIRKNFLKPGESSLHSTSTARKKRYIKEVGRTSCGIPIIRRIDKGKSIAQ